MTHYQTTGKRSLIMKQVKSRNTKPELFVRSIFWKNRLRYRVKSNKLPGNPDIVFLKPRIAVFVNGCFWHRHIGCKRASIPRNNAELWEQKFSKTVRRDEENYRKLIESGWKLILVWECKIKEKDIEQQLLNAFYSMVSSSEFSHKILSIG